MKSLEARLGVGFLTRTIRSVAATEAGEQLLEAIVPAFGAVSAALLRLHEARSVPAGTVRLTSVKHAARLFLAPALPAFLQRFPDVTVEICVDNHMRNIVADGFDAGIRLGERVDKDMVSLRISREIPTAVVAAPAYWTRHPVPASPHDLVGHECLGHRMGTEALHPWPFQEDGHLFSVKVKGQAVFNDSDLIIDAALNGSGLAYVFADQAREHLAAGRLVGVLERWTATHAGYFLHYASRRQQPPALAALIDWLRTATASARA